MTVNNVHICPIADYHPSGGWQQQFLLRFRIGYGFLGFERVALHEDSGGDFQPADDRHEHFDFPAFVCLLGSGILYGVDAPVADLQQAPAVRQVVSADDVRSFESTLGDHE